MVHQPRQPRQMLADACPRQGRGDRLELARISAGASGFMSHMSRWLPPLRKRIMQASAVESGSPARLGVYPQALGRHRLSPAAPPSRISSRRERIGGRSTRPGSFPFEHRFPRSVIGSPGVRHIFFQLKSYLTSDVDQSARVKHPLGSRSVALSGARPAIFFSAVPLGTRPRSPKHTTA